MTAAPKSPVSPPCGAAPRLFQEPPAKSKFPVIGHSAVLLAGLIVSLASAQAGEGRHLFILSGQSNMVGMKPELSFTPAVEEAFGKEKVIVVKSARSGAPIRNWYKDWKPAKGDKPGDNGRNYDILMKEVEKASKGEKIESATFFWMQGERDGKTGNGDVYEASMKGLIEQLRTDLKREDMNFVLGRISDHFNKDNPNEHWEMVRKAQVKVAEADPRGAWVDTDDLNGAKNELHYSKPGYETLGKRFAEASIKLIKDEAGKSP